MLNEPVNVLALDSTVWSTIYGALNTADLDLPDAAVMQLRLRDLTPTGSKRIANFGGARVELSISHSETKENSPSATRRTLIRLDRTANNTLTGKPETQSAYVVVAAPQSDTFVSIATPLMQLRELALFCLSGPLTADGDNMNWSDEENSIARVIDGEP